MASVKLTNSDVLTGIADRPGADMTARLLLALTALYVERPSHTPQEQQQYLELAQRLVDKVDAPTRATVAELLRRHPDAPTEIFARLEGAAPPAGDRGGARMGQTAVPPDAAAAPAAVPHAIAPPEIALDPAELGEVFFAASTTERLRLLSRVTADLGEGAADPDDAAKATDNDNSTYAELDAAAMQGRIGAFSREFERLLALPKSLCERILNDRSGEPMVVAAKATGMPVAVLQRILLLVNPAVSHSVQRVYDLTDLYHGLDRGVALKLLTLWRTRGRPNDPAADTRPNLGDRNASGLRDMSAAGLRSRFGALTERVQGVNARPDPGSVARRDLRSR